MDELAHTVFVNETCDLQYEMVRYEMVQYEMVRYMFPIKTRIPTSSAVFTSCWCLAWFIALGFILYHGELKWGEGDQVQSLSPTHVNVRTSETRPMFITMRPFESRKAS